MNHLYRGCRYCFFRAARYTRLHVGAWFPPDCSASNGIAFIRKSCCQWRASTEITSWFAVWSCRASPGPGSFILRRLVEQAAEWQKKHFDFSGWARHKWAAESKERGGFAMSRSTIQSLTVGTSSSAVCRRGMDTGGAGSGGVALKG